MADTATFSAAMKTRFLPPIRDSLHKGKVLLFGDADANPTGFRGILPRAEGINLVGNDFRIPLKARRNQAVGFRSENETLPAPGASGYTYLTEPLRYAYGLINITGQLLKAAASDEGAFVDAFKQEMEDTLLTMKIDFNRAAYGDGSGALATVAADPAAAAINVTPLRVNTSINFRGGELVDVVTATTGVPVGDVTSSASSLGPVTAVVRTAGAQTVTFGQAAGSWHAGIAGAGAEILVRASSDSTFAAPNNSWNREIQGLSSLVSDTGTVHGVNPTTYPFWKSKKSTGVGAISDTVLRNAKDDVGFESGVDLESGSEFVIVTTRGIRRRYSDTLLANRQVIASQTVNLHGGFSALMFDENPIFVDDQCPQGKVFGLSLKDFFWAQLGDWEWIDKDGSVLKWESRKDRFIAILVKYCQLGITGRNRHFVLEGVTDDSK